MPVPRKQEVTVFNHVIVPWLLILICTPGCIFLVWYEQGPQRSQWEWNFFIGNSFSWTLVAVFLQWAYVSLRVPSAKCTGPPTPFGYVPEYQNNGFRYYIVSTITFALLLNWKPDLGIQIYREMPHILGTLNILGLTLCVYLLLKGKNKPEHREELGKYPLVHEFYRGMELHPRIFNVDVKQLTNCRMGMMLWQVFVLAYLAASTRWHGLNWGFLVNALLHSLYVGKFFWWEAGYFSTLDITLDRAGYYLCWGCLVFIPSVCISSTYYLVARQPLISNAGATILLFLGVFFNLLTYRIDYEKEHFRASNGQCRLWGRLVTYIQAEYDTPKGKRTSKLLTSGCWGVARHLNYLCDTLAGFCWAGVGYHHGVWPFFYNLVFLCLMIHRIFRDENKCRKKYGKYYEEYCKKVPYRLIPGVF